MHIRDCVRGRLAAVFAASLLVATSARANLATHPDEVSTQQALVIGSFDGIWEGKIFFDKEAFLAPTSTPAEGTTMRIEIHDAVVRVFTKEDDGFTEDKPGAFHIAPVYANAVIFATDASPPWVESWVFVVTQKDDHTLIVEYSRLVNNVGTPLSNPESKFGTRGRGEFVRVQDPKPTTQ